MCYINSTLDVRMQGWAGNDFDSLQLTLYSDADFASDKQTSISVSGVFLCLTGPQTFWPLAAVSKKQTAVSHSTPEAEIVAADFSLRTEGLPALELWDVLLRRPATVTLMEDNSATAQIMRSGKFPTLRHVQRTHRVDVAWLHQQLEQKHYLLSDCSTAHMAADIFTKSFDDKKVGEWERNLLLIGHFRPPGRQISPMSS
jgi:hypothetical protein